MAGGAFRRKAADETGVYLVMYALLAVAIFGVVAIVLDLAALRHDRRVDRLAADFAVTAGAADLAPATPSTAADACRSAWSYFLGNRDKAPPVDTAPDCGTLGSLATCDPLAPPAPLTTTGRAGPFSVEITYPVPDGSVLMRADQGSGDTDQAVVPAVDGNACERLAVRIVRDRPYAFGGIFGFRSATTDVHAVGRAMAEKGRSIVQGLVVLEPEGCNAIATSGQGSVLVRGSPPEVDPVTGQVLSPAQPGSIVVDSSGSCAAGGSFVIDAAGGGGNSIRAESWDGTATGTIYSYAASGRPGTNPARAYEEQDVTAGRLAPRPTARVLPVTRALVDNRYNCVAPACPGASPDTDYRDRLVQALCGLTSPCGPPPAGFLLYPDPILFPGAGCDTQPVQVIVPPGNWFVDCPSGFSVDNNFTFLGGTIVFAGPVEVQSQGCLAVNDLRCLGTTTVPATCGAQDVTDSRVCRSEDNLVFVRNGDVSKTATGVLAFNRTFTYLHGGLLDAGGGGGALRLVAPKGPAASAASPIGPRHFEDLALWTESGQSQEMSGQADLQLEGAFFAPNATFTFTGASGVTQVQFAQFIVRRVNFGGQGSLTLQARPDRSVNPRAVGVRLIR